ncbi:hypothetical protein WA99_01560 [Streptococcus agalactiae]|uniref:hypothetical protein n=1 Tax=Streptococcus agalactiae TaxID=1311 RepID=UPI0006402545|nr:hypothetical protein [Streptococcus agalactiae]KLJ82618.1 hypothetical protein WA99_01560 [Streptococcus agalactiae]
MIKKYYNEGKVINLSELFELGFNLESNEYDILVDDSNDVRNNIESDKRIYGKLKICGILINKDNDSIVIFPKNYNFERDSANKDIELLFETFLKGNNIGSRHSSTREVEEDGFESNFPFEQFFRIYEYYSNYGLHFDNVKVQKKFTFGKINWNYTIKTSQKLIVDDDLILYPYYYDKTYNSETFLSDCTVYAIDYTIDKFSFFLKNERTGKDFPEYLYEYSNEEIVSRLERIREETFKEYLINLIDNLISYFDKVIFNGELYLKQLKFENIWEKMIEHYLNYYFDHIDYSETLPQIFYKTEPVHQNLFSKKSFFMNLDKAKQNIEIDHYAILGDTQLVFDAKYKNDITSLDNKQLDYHLLLKDMIPQKYWINENKFPEPLPDDVKEYIGFKNIPVNLNSEYMEVINEMFIIGIIQRKFKRTISALFIPSDMDKTGVNFMGDGSINPLLANTVILQEYLDIKKIMKFYTK